MHELMSSDNHNVRVSAWFTEIGSRWDGSIFDLFLNLTFPSAHHLHNKTMALVLMILS